MKIALSGTQSTGKTTLLKHMKKLNMFDGYEFIDEIVRNLVKQSGIKINENADNETQTLILNTHYINLGKENIVTDRCLLDSHVYSKYLYEHNSIDRFIYEYSKTLFENFIGLYDYIFYLPPHIPIDPDNVRSNSYEFREDTDIIFSELIEDYNLDNVYKIEGTVEERLNTIKNIINKENN